MSRTVFILGAGASQEAGGPLMKDFLEKAQAVSRQGNGSPNFDLVFQAISALTGTHSKAALDIYNIESVFAAIEMAALLETKLGDLETKDLQTAVRQLIVRTLERTIKFPIPPFNSGESPAPPIPYNQFAGLLRKMNQSKQSVAVITFNYDVSVEYALHRFGLSVDYCLDGKDQLSGIPLLKLHGSLNWAECPGCSNVVSWGMGECLQAIDRKYVTNDEGMPIHALLEISQRLPRFHHCGGHPVSSSPAIVPPTWNKTQYQATIAPVWKRAARELSTAENIIVIGYSLPDTDQFFRYLYALGTMGTAILQRIWLFDPNVAAIQKRYQTLIGSAVSGRFETFSQPFSKAVQQFLDNAAYLFS